MFLSGKAGRDVLKGGAGDDILYGFGGDDVLTGAGGHDVLAGHEGHDSLSGGAGDDYMLGGAGNDTLDGGAGVDWAAYEDAAAAVKVDLSLTAIQDTLGGGRDKLGGVENLYGSAFGDTLTGNAGVNFLSGGAGADRLEGGAGDDHLEGGDGNDSIVGGDGWDVVSYDGAIKGMTIDLWTGWAHDGGVFPNPPGHVDLLSGIEDVYGSSHNDVIVGNFNDNYLMGNDGDDYFLGRSGGSDTMDGGAGNDTFAHDDEATFTVIMGGEGLDMFDANAGGYTGGLIIDLRDGTVREASGDLIATISSVEHINTWTGNNVFYAAAGRSIFNGGSGNDRFVFTPGAAAVSMDPAQLDTIVRIADALVDEGSKISLGVTGAYEERTAASYADAYAAANGLIASGVRNIVAVEVGADVYVFADSLQANTLNTAIKLQIATLADVQEGTFI